MGALAYSGAASSPGSGPGSSGVGPELIRHLTCGEYAPMVNRAVKNDSLGESQPPCFTIYGGPASYRFRLPIKTGTWNLNARVFLERPLGVGPWPTLSVIANPELGIAASSVTAGSHSDWTLFPDQTITSSGNGGVFIEFTVVAKGKDVICHFDDLKLVLTEPFNTWSKGVPTLGYRRYSFVSWLDGAPIADEDFAWVQRRRVATISPMQ